MGGGTYGSHLVVEHMTAVERRSPEFKPNTPLDNSEATRRTLRIATHTGVHERLVAGKVSRSEPSQISREALAAPARLITWKPLLKLNKHT